VQTFTTAREAKEFLISRIVTEAQREGVPLSDVEVKMLYFSETGWAPPDFMEVNEAFERDCDTGEYERKIATLIRNFSTAAHENSPDDFDAWEQAIEVLGLEDHYLLVLISIADGSLTAAGADAPAPLWDRVPRLVAITVAVFVAVVILVICYRIIKG
jgi:hypothetical protein